MNSIEFTFELKDLKATAYNILKNLTSKTVVFAGDMGVGKTTLISALLSIMGSKDEVTSPTYSIVNEYNTSKDKVYHFDFYRVASIEEALDFGVEDYLNSNHWLFLEWPDRIAELLPHNYNSIEIKRLDNNTRTLKLTINSKLLTEKNAMTETKF